MTRRLIAVLCLSLLVPTFSGCLATAIAVADRKQDKTKDSRNGYDKLGKLWLDRLDRKWFTLKVKSDKRYTKLQLRAYRDHAEVQGWQVLPVGAEKAIHLKKGFVLGEGRAVGQKITDDVRGIRISEVNIRADALSDTCELYIMALPAEDMEPPREGEDPRSKKEEEKE